MSSLNDKLMSRSGTMTAILCIQVCISMIGNATEKGSNVNEIVVSKCHYLISQFVRLLVNIDYYAS